ncbi:MAG: ADOP family duplicated permease [Longimicrobiales bacterium]
MDSRKRAAAEVDEELRHHVEERADLLMHQGLTREAALAEARKRFGDASRIRRECIDQSAGARSGASLGAMFGPLGQDMRFALRTLVKRPLSAATSILTLALGIGASTAVFSLANWVALRPVPGVTDPDELLLVVFRDGGGRPSQTSHPNLVDLRTSAPAIAALAGNVDATLFAVSPSDLPAQLVRGALVSGNYFETVVGRMQLGRGFTAEEEASAHQTPTAVIGYRLWSRCFGADPAIVGKYVTLSGAQVAIVGVAPPGFEGTELLAGEELWMPAGARDRFMGSGAPASPTSPLESRDGPVYGRLLARVARGHSAAEARAQLETAFESLRAAYPPRHPAYQALSLQVFEGIGLDPDARGALQQALGLLGGVATVLLLIACLNVANLLLFRGVTRREEIAVRQALGASTARLMRSQLTECVVLSIAGGLVGIVLASGLTALFRGPIFAGVAEIDRIPLDHRVVAFAGGLSALVAIASGALPAWLAIRSGVARRLRGGGARAGAAGASLRSALAAGQVTLSVPLLILMLLLVGTIRNLGRVDVGFDADRVTSFHIMPGLSGYSREEAGALALDAIARLEALPGVEQAAVSGGLPFQYSIQQTVRSDLTPPGPDVPASGAWVAGSYFGTLGIPVLAGRVFDDGFVNARDSSALVTVLSRSLAQRLFGDQDPIGRRVFSGILGRRTRDEGLRVIGVVGDTRFNSLKDEGDGPVLYVPAMASTAAMAVSFTVRTRPGADARRALQQTMLEVAPSVPLYELQTLQGRINRYLGQDRLLAKSATALGLLAVLLACVGLYSVIAFAVAERTHEIGIRRALGAQRKDVLSMVVIQTARLGGVGLVLGMAAALGMSQIMEGRLFGVTPTEPSVYLLGAVVIAVVTLVAAAAPASAAARVDPMVALKHD